MGESGSRVTLKNSTLKKAAVDPPRKAPYFILVCLARSSALSMGESMRSTVRKAAKLAVYEEIIIRVKNHHIPATMRVETALEVPQAFKIFEVPRGSSEKVSL